MKNIKNFNNHLFEGQKIFNRTNNIYNIKNELLNNKSIPEILYYLNDNFIGKNIEIKSDDFRFFRESAIIINVIGFSYLKIDSPWSLFIIKADAEIGSVFLNSIMSKNIRSINIFDNDIITELKDVINDVEKNYNKDIDPYEEEDWDDEYIRINESIKKKIYKIKRFEIDPYGEEDWGWDYNNDIDESKFANKFLIYKKRNYKHYEYKSLILKTHNETILGRNLNDMLDYNNVIPLTKREIDRIKNNKICFSTYHSKYDLFGGLQRLSYSDIKNEPYFLDQEYIDKYLNVEYVKENIR